MTFVGHLGGPWRTEGDFCRSLGGGGGSPGTIGNFCRSLGGFLGGNG